MGKARNPPTRFTTHRVWSVLSCPRWPLHHRMCVITERLSYLRWLAHAAGRWPFLWRLHILAHFFPSFGLFNAEWSGFKKMEIIYPQSLSSSMCAGTCVLRAAGRWRDWLDGMSGMKQGKWRARDNIRIRAFSQHFPFP